MLPSIRPQPTAGLAHNKRRRRASQQCALNLNLGLGEHPRANLNHARLADRADDHQIGVRDNLVQIPVGENGGMRHRRDQRRQQHPYRRPTTHGQTLPRGRWLRKLEPQKRVLVTDLGALRVPEHVTGNADVERESQKLRDGAFAVLEQTDAQVHLHVPVNPRQLETLAEPFEQRRDDAHDRATRDEARSDERAAVVACLLQCLVTFGGLGDEMRHEATDQHGGVELERQVHAQRKRQGRDVDELHNEDEQSANAV